jgi:hypothetical protein
VTAIFDMLIWVYLATFLYPGLVFGMMRGYIEHRWGEGADVLEQLARRTPRLSGCALVQGAAHLARAS